MVMNLFRINDIIKYIMRIRFERSDIKISTDYYCIA